MVLKLDHQQGPIPLHNALHTQIPQTKNCTEYANTGIRMHTTNNRGAQNGHASTGIRTALLNMPQIYDNIG